MFQNNSEEEVNLNTEMNHDFILNNYETEINISNFQINNSVMVKL